MCAPVRIIQGINTTPHKERLAKGVSQKDRNGCTCQRSGPVGEQKFGVHDAAVFRSVVLGEWVSKVCDVWVKIH